MWLQKTLLRSLKYDWCQEKHLMMLFYIKFRHCLWVPQHNALSSYSSIQAFSACNEKENFRLVGSDSLPQNRCPRVVAPESLLQTSFPRNVVPESLGAKSKCWFSNEIIQTLQQQWLSHPSNAPVAFIQWTSPVLQSHIVLYHQVLCYSLQSRLAMSSWAEMWWRLWNLLRTYGH